MLFYFIFINFSVPLFSVFLVCTMYIQKLYKNSWRIYAQILVRFFSNLWFYLYNTRFNSDCSLPSLYFVLLLFISVENRKQILSVTHTRTKYRTLHKIFYSSAYNTSILSMQSHTYIYNDAV